MSAPLYLVDASIYIFQAHFSPHMQVWSRRSEDRSAFVGFTRFMLRLLREVNLTAASAGADEPPRIAVAFDQSLFSGFRHRLYPEYKSNRVLPDENLARQLQACARLCETLGIRGFGSQEYEADDIIGTLSKRARGDSPVVIVSRDKDLSQLLSNADDRLWDYQNRVRRGRNDIFTHYGIWPEQFPCYLGLTGDAIDCIPGVPGIGPVAARALLTHFKSLDALYEDLDTVASLSFRGAGTCAQKLTNHRQQAILSRSLAQILCCDDGEELFSQVSATGLRQTDQRPDDFSALLNELGIADDDLHRLRGMLDALQNR